MRGPLFHISGFSILVRSLLYGNQIFYMSNLMWNLSHKILWMGCHPYVCCSGDLGTNSTYARATQCESVILFKLMLAGGGPVPLII